MKNLFNVEGKLAIVTGGSRGTGEMIASGFVWAFSAVGIIILMILFKARARHHWLQLGIPVGLKGSSQLYSNQIQRGRQRRNLSRKIAMYACQLYGEHRLPDIAKTFGLSPGGASNAIGDPPFGWRWRATQGVEDVETNLLLHR